MQNKLLGFIILFLLSTPVFASGNHKTPDAFTGSQVSYWELDEASGSRIDNNANSNDLTDNNTVGNVSDGTHGTVADFESTNTEYLSITDGSQTGLDLSSDLTIAAWINLETAPSTLAANSHIVSKFRSAGNRAYRLFLTTGDLVSCQLSNDGTATASATGATVLATSTWYHIACTFDATNQDIAVFVNGKLDGLNQSAGFGSIFNSGEAFTVGTRSTGTTDQLLDGQLHQLGVWSTNRSASDIALLAGKKDRLRTS